MSVTIKVRGAVEKSYRFDDFPTDAELERLGFFGEYKLLSNFEDKLREMRRKAEDTRTDGLLKFKAVLRKGNPAVRAIRMKEE
jgi:hypothetical protein